MLTVKQLITKLKKMPPGLPVVWQDHDQSEHEFNDFACKVEQCEIDDHGENKEVVVIRR